MSEPNGRPSQSDLDGVNRALDNLNSRLVVVEDKLPSLAAIEFMMSEIRGEILRSEGARKAESDEFRRALQEIRDLLKSRGIDRRKAKRK